MLGSINKIYNVGIYIRLSREDDDKVMMSESITNQKSLLLQYVKENNLRVYDIYIDDGYSGTNFDRPDFNRLLNDIELGRVNMVITKDMSRLGRDYIGTGNLIEKYFPEHNVRYIAVTDNIDTFLDNSNNDIAPFKAIMNDMYAKDISKKIKSSLRAKQKEGKWVGSRTPFGYEKNIKNKNQLVVNQKQALVVKKMTIGIIVAMSKELNLLLPLLNEPSQKNIDGFKFHIGSIGDKTIVAMQCGIGKVNAAIGTITMIKNFEVDLIINSGVAGGADSSVNVMDIVIGEKVAYHDVYCGPESTIGGEYQRNIERRCRIPCKAHQCRAVQTKRLHHLCQPRKCVNQVGIQRT